MGARWSIVLWWRDNDPEHGLHVYFIGVGYLKLKQFCRLRETLWAKIVLFPGYINDKYVFYKSYSHIQLKLVALYFILIPCRFWLLSPPAWIHFANASSWVWLCQAPNLSFDTSLHRPPHILKIIVCIYVYIVCICILYIPYIIYIYSVYVYTYTHTCKQMLVWKDIY